MQTPHRTAIVSHRGGALLWPENSLEAFSNSLDLPLEQVECDVHPSSDGVPVVIHDATLQRMTEERGAVSARDLAALTRLRLKGARGGTLPSLAEVATLLTGKPKQLQVEIKDDAQGLPYPGLLERSLTVLDIARIRGQCRIIAFNAEVAAAAQRAGGLAGVIWLFERRLLREIGLEGVIGVARAYGFKTVETEIGALDATVCARLREAGLRLAAWGANDAQSLTKAFGLGLDAVATDDPVLALRLRG